MVFPPLGCPSTHPLHFFFFLLWKSPLFSVEESCLGCSGISLHTFLVCGFPVSFCRLQSSSILEKTPYQSSKSERSEMGGLPVFLFLTAEFPYMCCFCTLLYTLWGLTLLEQRGSQPIMAGRRHSQCPWGTYQGTKGKPLWPPALFSSQRENGSELPFSRHHELGEPESSLQTCLPAPEPTLCQRDRWL